jgi:hypothetical protein
MATADIKGLLIQDTVVLLCELPRLAAARHVVPEQSAGTFMRSLLRRLRGLTRQ